MDFCRYYLFTIRHLQESARERGSESRVTQVYLHKDFSHKDFVKLLKNEGMSTLKEKCLKQFDYKNELCLKPNILM